MFFFLASTRIVKKKSNTQSHNFSYPTVCLLAFTEYKLQDVTAVDHSNHFLVYAVCPSAWCSKIKGIFRTLNLSHAWCARLLRQSNILGRKLVPPHSLLTSGWENRPGCPKITLGFEDETTDKGNWPRIADYSPKLRVSDSKQYDGMKTEVTVSKEKCIMRSFIVSCAFIRYH